jgi:hypothetical protein
MKKKWIKPQIKVIEVKLESSFSKFKDLLGS